MNENRHDKMPSRNLDDLFRSAVDSLDESPSPAVWETVEKDLDKNNIINIKKKYNNLKKIAVALVLILSSTLIYEFQTHHYIFGDDIAYLKVMHNNKQENNVAAKEVAVTDLAKRASRSDLSQSSVTPTIAGNPPAATIKTDEVVTGTNGITTLMDAGSSQKSLSESFQATANKISRPSPFPTSDIKGGRNVGPFIERNMLSGNSPSSLLKENTGRLLLSTFPNPVDLVYSQHLHATSPGNDVINVFNADNLLAVKNKVVSDDAPDLAQQSIILSQKMASRFSLNLIFSPDFTSRLIKEDWPVNREDNRDEIRKTERYGFSYSFGALVDYKLSKHWGIQSGFTLSRAVINFSPKFIFARPDDLGDVKYKFNSSSGYSYLSPHTMSRPVFGDSLHAFGSTSSLLYLSVPVVAKYKIATKKLDFYASAGVAANILVNDKIQTYLFSGGNHEVAVNHDIRGLKPVYYSALIGAGVSYNLNSRLAVNFTPTARVALTSINKDAPVKSYQQSLGMVAGVQIRF